MTTKHIFISYRRDDTAPHALALRAELERRLKGIHVFLDTQRIQAMEQWPAVLQNALSKADAFLCLVGPGWLNAASADGQLRLFDPEDWVRREVAYSLQHLPKLVMPVLIDGAVAPGHGQLPSDLKSLAAIQALAISTARWDQDIVELCSVLCDKLGFQRLQDNFHYPTASPETIKGASVSAERLSEVLTTKRMEGWSVEGTDDPRFADRMWLTKKFKFEGGFNAALQFMNEIGAYCEMMQHHPRWENIHRELLVRLATFEAGHRITENDIMLAARMNEVADKLERR